MKSSSSMYISSYKLLHIQFMSVPILYITTLIGGSIICYRYIYTFPHPALKLRFKSTPRQVGIGS